MYHNPEYSRALHAERQRRFQAEAARVAARRDAAQHRRAMRHADRFQFRQRRSKAAPRRAPKAA
ncbi:MAG: hypothetical protein ACRDY7_10790 [Acidimicrobiia bacterium]